MGDKRKQSFYIPLEMLEQIEAEAKRQQRSLAWIIQNAWRIAYPTIKTYPTAPIPG